MSTATSAGTVATGLLGYEDLAVRWQVQGPTPEAINRNVRRICVRIGLAPLAGFGRGERARFRPSAVERCEANMDATGGRRS